MRKKRRETKEKIDRKSFKQTGKSVEKGERRKKHREKKTIRQTVFEGIE